MPKYTDMLQLCAADALPALALGAPKPRAPARPVAPAWAPVAGKPHLWQAPGGAMAYRPPEPTKPQPAIPPVHASQVGKVDMLAGKPRGLYEVKRKGLAPAFRYWDGESLSQSFSTAHGAQQFANLRAGTLRPPGEDGSIEWANPVEDVTDPLYLQLKRMGRL